MQNDHTPVNPQGSQPNQNPQDRAADAVRAQIGHIYDNNPPNQLKSEQQPTQQTDDNPYHRTHQENFDWRNYHSAWQNYYQQYYQRYYGQQLQVERQKLNTQKITDASGSAQHIITGADPTGLQKTKVAQLKQNITETIKAQAKNARQSSHFVPIASACAVGFVFLFLQFNSVMVAQVKAYVSPGNLSNDALIVDPTVLVNVGPEPKLIIPKINVEVPVDYNVSGLTESQIQTSLRDGATHYNLPGADAVPGQFGNTVILGHSSNDIFNQGKYKFVFVLLDRVQAGDTFYLNYSSTRYIYKVTDTKVIDPSEVNTLQIGTAKPMATLVTCTPPGTALKRLVIFGEQISPDPSASVKPAPSSASQPQNTTIPGNEPNWLDNIWNFFF